MSIRRALRPVDDCLITTKRGGYEITVDQTRIDLHRMEELTTQATLAASRGDAAAALECVTAAIALNRGPVGHGLDCGRALAARLTALNEQRLTMMEDLITAELTVGGYAEAARHLRHLLGEAPLRERSWGLLMRALYGLGDTAGALRAFGEARAALVDLLGIEPGAELRDIHHAVLQRDPDLVTAGVRPEIHAARPPGAVHVDEPNWRPPRQLPLDSRFTGREREVDTLVADVSDDREVPLIRVVYGTFGVGKSALALHAAHLIASCFPDGQLYADLDDPSHGEPRTADRVITWFLRELGDPRASAVSGPAEAMPRFRSLTSRLRLLILLDNVVHESQVAPLLPAGPGCAVLVTSRRALTLDHADLHRLGVMRPPDSVALLAAFAGDERVRTEPDAAAELAARCDHLPFALRAVGALLSTRPDTPLRGVLAEFADDPSRILRRYGDPGVSRRLGAAYERLACDDPEAAQMLSHLGKLGDTEITAAAAAAASGGCPARAGKALDLLCDEQLVERVPPDGYRPAPLIRLLGDPSGLASP
ncbi:BTAD domain-containing putative transcriptional regulator [Actinomadura sp. NPDC047616]|uniref:AfsR/SARP family transcriptional regulator n=1 Tax=Actinomadura sp. NPDC047616 TaxID=3155914 RepID=UPI0033D971BB